MATMNPVETQSDRELLISRVIDAPRELVFTAWSKLAHVSQWWGPNGFTTTTQERQFRPGGTWTFVMHGPDGQDYKNRIIFLDIVRNERIEFKHSGEEEFEPVKFRMTVTFDDLGGKTRLTMRSIFETAAERNDVIAKYGALEGGKQTLGRLDDYVTKTLGKRNNLIITLPSDRDIYMERVVDAPQALVWKAFTDAELIPHWWGPAFLTTTIDKLDVRPGGKWRFIQRAPDGQEFGFNGEFREVVPIEKIAWTFEFEPMQGHISVQTVLLEKLGSKTRLKISVKFDSREDRDGMLYSGMEEGAAEGYDRLESLLQKQR